MSPNGIVSQKSNATLQLIFDLVLEFIFSIYVQKIGVRCNDPSLIMAGRYVFMLLFYAFPHHIYQNMETFSLCEWATYPPDIVEFMMSNMAVALSDDVNHQGIDFIMEEKIKAMKMVAAAKLRQVQDRK